jgi:MFS family permease
VPPFRRLRRFAVDITPLRRSRDFRLLWFAELVSQIGSQIAVVALFVQVDRLTGSAAAVGLIGLTQLIPSIFASFAIGPLIDRMDRRVIMRWAQLGLAATSSLLLIGALNGDPPLALLYVAAALNASLSSIVLSTRAAITPNVVPAELLPASSALNQAMWSTAGIVGFALGGVIVGGIGLSWAYGIDLATYVAAFGLTLLLSAQRPKGEPGPERGMAAALAGMHFLKGKRVLQSTFTVDIVAMVFGMPRALFPILAREHFDRGPTAVGFLFAAVAVGALIGAVASGWIGRIQRHGLAILLAVTVWGAAITMFGLVDNFVVALVCLAIGGGADVISAVFRNTIQQLTVPDELRGRMSAFNILVVSGGPRLGDLEAGLVAAATSPVFSVVSGGLLCLAGVGVIAARVPRFARWRPGDAP